MIDEHDPIGHIQASPDSCLCEFSLSRDDQSGTSTMPHATLI
jgi:hypothetical protein